MSSFSASEFQRKAAEQRPWRSRPSTGGSSASGSRRAARAQVKALTGERTEILQAYLSAQLSNLTDDNVREAVSLGMSVAGDSVPVGSGLAAAAAVSESRRGRGSRPGSRATSLSSLDGQELLDALNDERARPLDRSERIVPGDDSTYSRPSTAGSTTNLQAPLVERWPAQMTKPKPTDLEPPPPRFQSRRPPLHPVESGEENRSTKLPPPVSSIADATGSAGGMTDQLMKSAPKLLSDLEFFVSAELQAAGVAGTEHTGHAERLRIFGECFECFIEHCTTYQPLLSKVKAEYDTVISQLKAENDSIQPTTTKLAVMEEEQTDELVMQQNAFLRETHGLREALKQAQWEREGPQQHQPLLCLGLHVLLPVSLCACTPACTRRLICGGLCHAELVEKVQRQSAELKKLRQQTATDRTIKKEKDELNDALSAGINHLKMINVDSETIFKEREQLRLALDEANHKINMLKIKNEGGVGKSEWDSWCKRFHTLEKDFRMQKRENERLKRDLDKKGRNEARAEARLARMKIEFEEMKHMGTPRPAVQDLCHALEMNAEELYSAGGRSTKEVLAYTVLQLENTKAELERIRSMTPNDDPYFMGLGPGGDGVIVPPYLRTKKNAQIRNRRMPKKDVESIIKTIWKKKTWSDAQMKKAGKKPKELPEFFFDFLKMEYGVQVAIAEVAYNLLDSCKRYNYDADIELFHKVMMGTLDDDVYYDQMKMLDGVKKTIQAFCTDDKGKAKKGKPSKPDLINLMTEFFPYKDEKDIAALKDALDRDHPKKKGAVKWKELFEEDREGNQLAFVETLRDQHLQDREDYFQEMEEAICSFDPDQDGDVTVPQLKEAFKSVDPNKSEDEMMAIIRRGLMRDRPKGSEGYPRSCYREFEPLPPEDTEFLIVEFMQHVRAVNVSRSGPKQERKHKSPSMLDMKQEHKTSLVEEMHLAGLPTTYSEGGADGSSPQKAIMEKYDTNHDGILDGAEVVAMTKDLASQSTEA